MAIVVGVAVLSSVHLDLGAPAQEGGRMPDGLHRDLLIARAGDQTNRKRKAPRLLQKADGAVSRAESIRLEGGREAL